MAIGTGEFSWLQFPPRHAAEALPAHDIPANPHLSQAPVCHGASKGAILSEEMTVLFFSLLLTRCPTAYGPNLDGRFLFLLPAWNLRLLWVPDIRACLGRELSEGRLVSDSQRISTCV
ncbi:hypothetical protein H112_00022 [Trichophyton rubrum D6]|uniref:Uncharacterized protein n=2 Tax=Trichophyton rubrum TaxID=5551 RepID=A0A080WRZ5_TRIRC|nr:uncharacterized protein TERG_12715 [Trichophyton rubrum CBS 118892]EZF28042.1 hypothetical protein H100_00021 [Trichophyton rubrum MR850]EZF47110.1 hypothetical protein H102_00021 [Trichophyton rubrum CBS 100081]EZF57764.1 hypothetical protein H103_00021 [Trichophyton rubrum CBS 288.86]EZF68360.1 hypothetical protein H104_00020 [Trichophyton rubrum CBS 289.86]EZF89670.1 hypothetical protein H110_00021 [Trichophyton rubrum MR1448]EZG00485.1 hypothetical protein H113_00023 [Trichophyton rubr